MTEKEKFKSPKARYTGGDILSQTEDIRSEFIDRYSEMDSEPKNHTLRLSPIILERMKDYVYYQKLNGKPFYSQGELVESAVNDFFNRLGVGIPTRPEEVRDREGKRTGRRKKSKVPYSNHGLRLD